MQPKIKNFIDVSIDYICEDDRFPVSGNRVTISNRDLLSSSEKGLIYK
jgi:hypothetical protein